MSNFQLKIIAIIGMFAGHIGYGLAASPYIKANFELEINLLYVLGSIAPPIFAFLISEGVVHTRSVRKYFTVMCIFALVSEIPYNMLRSVYRFHTLSIFYPRMQNVLFTLALGIAAIVLYKKLVQQTDFLSRFFCILLIMITLITAHLLRVDYGWIMVFAILMLYILRNSRLRLPIFAVLMLIYFLLMSYTPQFYRTAGTLIAIVLLYLYNGQRGAKINKWFFYIFYPVHLLVIAFFAAAIFGYL
ncbi:MAG: conjugal transfer protein TraX [Paludibacter sp.]|nr:conjugal transfer protein TraX [Paludibacter sp.]